MAREKIHDEREAASVARARGKRAWPSGLDSRMRRGDDGARCPQTRTAPGEVERSWLAELEKSAESLLEGTLAERRGGGFVGRPVGVTGWRLRRVDG